MLSMRTLIAAAVLECYCAGSPGRARALLDAARRLAAPVDPDDAGSVLGELWDLADEALEALAPEHAPPLAELAEAARDRWHDQS